MKKNLIFVLAFLGVAMKAQGVTSPSSVFVKVYEMRVSKNSNCSSAISVFRTASPTAVNLFASPGFGSAVISTGTYHCVMFNISDQVTFTPVDNLAAPACMAGMAYTADIFHAGSPNSISPDGMTITPTAGADMPWIYFSDAGSATITQTVGSTLLSCLQPTPGASNACAMGSFNVFSNQTRSLVVDFDNQIGPFGGPCTTHTPVLSVR